MVLRLKTWESRSSPNLIRSSKQYLSTMTNIKQNRRSPKSRGGFALWAIVDVDAQYPSTFGPIYGAKFR
ncbi:MAG: hypothetical protein ABJN05_13820, partial [Sulfitobacter dubius]|uniref:hypothetical protein n=1 Tax=Litoreibacter sp. TaxID=1969459 RepID=UPI00329A2AC0